MLDTVDAKLKEIEQTTSGAKPLPDNTTPLDFLRSVYCSPDMPLHSRLKAAVEAAQYVHPKLSVTASLDGAAFADRLEKAFSRSAKVIEVEPTRPKTMVSDRRFRRA